MKIISIKVTCTNCKNTNPKKLPNLNWIDSRFWIKECLESLLSTNKNSFNEGDIICIGNGDWSYVKITSINPLNFDINKEYLNIIKEKYQHLSKIFSKPDIEFIFNNKYNFLELFTKKYPKLYKKLDDRYDAIEYGGNIVDFNGDWVIYTKWDDEDESGEERKLCKIENLI